MLSNHHFNAAGNELRAAHAKATGITLGDGAHVFPVELGMGGLYVAELTISYGRETVKIVVE